MYKSIKLFCLGALIFFSCNNNQDLKENNVPAADELPADRIKEQFVKANQLQLKKENDEIDAYVRNHRLPFRIAPSGIRYHVYKPSPKGDSIRPGALIALQYKVSLLDGTVCYSSADEGSRMIKVGEADIESGIHTGLQYLKRGDKALLILPSHLAHGLLGDMRKIPARMPIVYNVVAN
jgi:FKBP-type peptidyl-prolyl cis-trans isomerase FkpA